MKEKFNPNDWLTIATHTDATCCVPIQQQNVRAIPCGCPNPNDDIETIISRLETAQTDITANYSDWRDIGFAIADEFGEVGRDYFHRISRFHSGYSLTDCNKQYDNCLKAKGHGITLKTFFHLAKQAGIDISCRDAINCVSNCVSYTQQLPNLSASARPDSVEEAINTIFNTPQLPPEIYSNLPEILRESADLFLDSVEKDVFLIGSIAVLSGCLPNISGIYFDEPHTAHLYAFITAPAGSGKGKMKWSKYFGQAIHDHMTEQSRNERAAYESELEQYNNLTKAQRQGAQRPEEPPRKMFFIPANSSSSAFIQALSDNNFSGVLFETEADTLADTFKQEWGNFSDVLRKAFHHESTSMFRRKDNEFIEIRDPHISIALSGTPKQVHNMMPDVENGLFSRFLFYAFEDNSDFKNPFVSHRPVNYTDFFKEKAIIIFELHQQLNNLREPVSFQLNDEQGLQFTELFNTMLSRNKLLLGRDFDANIKRLGLITFRVASILSALRILETGELPNPMICSDLDFRTAMTIAATLEKHAIAVFQNLPNNDLKGAKLKFFEKLPPQFDRQGYLKVAEELGIHPKTAEKYISQFKPKLLHHEHNQYIKIVNSTSNSTSSS
ncbi:MAG: DUF3987 domain-containing protein [Prolixibacteraceae bacterium]|nr:DUF3987 domain-containing protein [Prolixibacteraceae bacterium]